MKKIRENIINFILIVIIILICYSCKNQLKWVLYFGERVENFKFIFPFVGNQITNDTFFTIAIGKSIVENGFTNMDTLTWHENLSFPHSGVFDLIIFGIYSLTENFNSIYIYTIIMTCILLATIFLVSYKTSKNLIVSIIYVCAIWYLGRHTFYARAYQFSFIFFVLEFYFLQKLREEGKYRYAIILCLLGILVANIHSSVYPIYLVMFVPHIIDIIFSKFNLKIPKVEILSQNGDRLFIKTAVLAIFTGLFTSTGFAPYTDMIKAMIGISNEFIGELSKSNINNNKTFFVILINTILFIILGKQKVKIVDILYILGFGLLTLLVFRGYYFFLFISGISITRIVVSFFNENEVKTNKYIRIILSSTLTVLFILLILSEAFRVMDYELVSNDIYPVKLSEYMMENLNLDEIRIYNGFNYGSYLEYKGIKAFIDSRSGMFTEEFNNNCTILKDWYSIYNGDKKFFDIFKKYGITHAVCKIGDNLSQDLNEDANWILVYSDEYWALYQKK